MGGDDVDDGCSYDSDDGDDDCDGRGDGGVFFLKSE